MHFPLSGSTKEKQIEQISANLFRQHTLLSGYDEMIATWEQRLQSLDHEADIEECQRALVRTQIEFILLNATNLKAEKAAHVESLEGQLEWMNKPEEPIDAEFIPQRRHAPVPVVGNFPFAIPNEIFGKGRLVDEALQRVKEWQADQGESGGPKVVGDLVRALDDIGALFGGPKPAPVFPPPEVPYNPPVRCTVCNGVFEFSSEYLKHECKTSASEK